MPRFILIVVITMLSTISLLAAPNEKVPIVNLPVLNGGEQVIAPVAYPPYNLSSNLNTDEIGDTIKVGTTWYENQHNGTIGRMLEKDADGWIHVAWMNGLDYGVTTRHIYYNLLDPNYSLIWSGTGTQVDAAQRSGFCTLDVYTGGSAIIAFHEILGSAVDPITAVANDILPHCGAFISWEVPNQPPPGMTNNVIWPRMQIDHQQRIHFVSTETNVDPGYPQRIMYSYGNYDPGTFTITYPTPNTWTYVDTTMTLSAEVATSEVSNKVAFAWSHPRIEAGDSARSQVNNDIYLVVDNDGQNLNFSHPLNVTNFIPPNPSFLPDTLRADMDTLRAYTDVGAFFDFNDNLHLVFTTLGFWYYEGTTTSAYSLIWHWCEAFPNDFNLVAHGWYPSEAPPGAWSRNVQRPCLGQNVANGYLYCMYQQYDQRPNHISAHGYPSGEVFLSVSTDGGQSWSVGTNVTSTATPNNAPAGECLSEFTPSMGKIVDNYCHILYVLDRDAGNAVQNEGEWTLNTVYYHQVPTDSIPTTPLMPNTIPFHVQTGPAPQIQLSAYQLNFGEVAINTTSTRPLTIYNTGDAYLIIYSITSDLTVFSTNFNPLDSLITPGDSLNLIVSFRPTASTSYEGTLTISNNDQPGYVQMQGTGVSPVDVSLTPLNPPIIIPPGGGLFSFSMSLHNLSSQTQTVDSWLQIELPGGGIVPAASRNNIALPGGITVNRNLTQQVPAFAPAGTYTYHGYVGDYPWVIQDQDSFTFVKTGMDLGDSKWSPADWLCLGDFFDEYVVKTAVIPEAYSLSQNYPNPFNPLTSISFSLPQAALVKLTVFDVMGREVAVLVNGMRDAGTHSVTFDASGLASGIYLYKLEAGDFSAVSKMVLMK